MIIEDLGKLLITIAKQDVPLRVLNAGGQLEREFANPKAALSIVAMGGFFGRGNHRRISYIQPFNGDIDVAIACGAYSDRVDATDGFDARRSDRQIRPELPVAKLRKKPGREREAGSVVSASVRF